MTRTTTPYDSNSVVQFWRDAGESRWFSADPAFDDQFRQRFIGYHLAAAARKLDSWSESAPSSLALILLLDQFPRNAFRNTAHMFATDPLARLFASKALEQGFDVEMESKLRKFFYLPFMHSEVLADQERSVALFRELGETKYVDVHYDLIRRFGRFPHRNLALARRTTPEEQAFLDAGGFSG